jgi:UDP-N-acetyl-2-amino-2-deoxyglucuronate dehydrogenase
MSERTYGFGIIGAGVIAPTHCKAIQSIPEARLVSVCDIDRQKATALAMRFGIRHSCTDAQELLGRPDVDVVNVLAWSGVHAELGMLAARAGKHVICTKPIDVRLGQIDRLIHTCRAHNVKLGVTHQFRSYPAYRQAKQAIDDGRLGRLLLGNAALKWWRSQAYYDSAEWRGTWALDGGGALMNQGIHYVDLLQWLMGPVRRVRGLIATQNHQMEVEDTASVTLEFASGALGCIQAATCIYQGLPARVELHGERGNIIIEDDRICFWDLEGEERIETSGLTNTGSSADPGSGLDESMEAHLAQISDVIQAIKEDREPELTGEEGRKAVEIIVAAYRSALRGDTIDLPLR